MIGQAGLVPIATATGHRVWFDTFDGDVWNAGLVLEADRTGRGQEVTLRSRDDHSVRWVQRVDDVPRAAEDLPAGPWRRSLGAVLGLRALVPVAEAQVTVTDAARTDARGKRVVEVRIEDVASGEGGATGWVRVVPVRGYERDAADLATLLGALDALTATDEHPLIDLAPRFVGDTRSPVVDLDPDLPAHRAMAAMLDRFERTMTDIEPWLDDPPDTEFLHDYRVALRRSRSVLKLARGVLDPADLDRWRPELRDLQQRTGPLRDLDVFVLEFGDHHDMVPAEFAAELGPFRELLDRRRADEQRRLRRYLATALHERRRRSYRAFLDALLVADAPDTPDTPDAASPIAEVGAARIRAAHRRVVRRGRRIDAGSPAEDLHEVRIAGKELRYAIELHSSLLDPEARKELVVTCKSLQDLLGAFQDAEVHAAAMYGFADELVAAGDAPARCIMALGLLAQGFADREVEIRARFAASFARFERPETAEVLDRAVGRSET